MACSAAARTARSTVRHVRPQLEQRAAPPHKECVVEPGAVRADQHVGAARHADVLRERAATEGMRGAAEAQPPRADRAGAVVGDAVLRQQAAPQRGAAAEQLVQVGEAARARGLGAVDEDEPQHTLVRRRRRRDAPAAAAAAASSGGGGGGGGGAAAAAARGRLVYAGDE